MSDIERLTEKGAKTLRVMYPDLHGIARGKDLVLADAGHEIEDGVAFCSAIMTTDLAHTPVMGGEIGYPDFFARPDLSTAAALPWAPDIAACLVDLVDEEGNPHPFDPRGAVRRAADGLAELGLAPIVGPELEFFLFRPDDAAPEGAVRYVDTLSRVYTVGAESDPGGISGRMLHACAEMGLGAYAANHEFMNAQYEINLRHGPALDAADRAFRLKATVKEIAVLEEMRATFMGRPFNDQGGSGLHLHVSLQDGDGANRIGDPAGPDGLSAAALSFIAGVLEHAGALMAFLNPTVNAFKRIAPDSLAPINVSWGLDNRTTFVRVPPERGKAARLEIRVGDGTANCHLAVAALLQAGLDGVRRELEAPEQTAGDAYRREDLAPLPSSLDQALDALEADELLCDGVGREIVDAFLTLKRFELERYHGWVTDWERNEYRIQL